MDVMLLQHCGCNVRLHIPRTCDGLWWNFGSVGLTNRRCKEYKLNEVLQEAELMEQQGISISRNDMYYLLLECTKQKDLTAGRRVHSLMAVNGLDSITVLGDHLIRMFASCGSLIEAKQAFDKLLNPSVHTWNSILSAHAQLGDGKKTLELYYEMQQEGTFPVNITFLFILKACSNMEDVTQGRLIYDQIIKNGFESDMVVGTALVNMYGKFGNVEEGRKVFDRMSNRDVVSWSAMMAGYAQHGYGFQALELFEKMQGENIKPGVATFLCISKACGSIGAIGQGRLIHKEVCISGLESDVVVGNSLIDMHAKCGSLNDAHQVFDGLSKRNVISWGALVTGYVQHGLSVLALELFKNMQEEGFKPSEILFLNMLKVCVNIDSIMQGRLIHDQIIQAGYELDVLIGSTLIDMYAKCRSLEEARAVFDGIRTSNVASWSAMIGGYALHGHGFLALQLFDEMEQKGIKASKSTLIFVLKACGSVGALARGRLIHDQITRRRLNSDTVIGSNLVDMYSKCGSLDEACKVFEELPDRDVVAWNAMVVGYAEYGDDLAALSSFENMQEEGIKPDKVVFLSILKACASIQTLDVGRMIHDQIVRDGIILDVVIGSTLVDMYAKCGSVWEACRVLLKLPNRDAVAWSSLIAGCVHLGYAVAAIELFEKLQEEAIEPSKVIFLFVLKASACLGSMQQSRLVHAKIMGSGLESDVEIGSSLVDMYVKCGSLQEAGCVFKSLPNRDVVSWGAMIAGYTLEEHNGVAFDFFEKMLSEGIKPDKVTFLCIIKACISSGAIGQGRLIHNHIIFAEFESDVDLGTALIDMYAKSGCLEEAYEVFKKLPEQNVVSCSAIIAGFALHGNSRIAKQCFEDMQRKGLKPDSVIFLSILVACSREGLLVEGCQYFKSMREDFGITPDLKHYNCMVDLLGRAGYLNEAQDLLQSMPVLPDNVGWLSLLSGCKTYGGMGVGRLCFDEIVRADGNEASGYVLMSNIYADGRMWDCADEIQDLRKYTGAWKKPGKAWVEINDTVHEFLVGDQKQIEGDEIFKSSRISQAMKGEGYMPELGLVLEIVPDLEEDTLYAI